MLRLSNVPVTPEARLDKRGQSSPQHCHLLLRAVYQTVRLPSNLVWTSPTPLHARTSFTSHGSTIFYLPWGGAPPLTLLLPILRSSVFGSNHDRFCHSCLLPPLASPAIDGTAMVFFENRVQWATAKWTHCHLQTPQWPLPLLRPGPEGPTTMDLTGLAACPGWMAGLCMEHHDT